MRKQRAIYISPQREESLERRIRHRTDAQDVWPDGEAYDKAKDILLHETVVRTFMVSVVL